MNIRVTGYKGRLGSELILKGALPFDCDVTKPKEIELEMQAQMPDVIINCAAYTNVDGAVSNYKQALEVNYSGVKNLLNVIDEVNPNCKFIQISTDYVFHGNGGPYKENAVRSEPVNDYGLTKFAAEMLVWSWDWGNWTIVRTTGLFGSRCYKGDFVRTVLDNIASGRPIEVTETLFGNQTYTPFLASQIVDLAQRKQHPKIIHLASQDVISRYEFAKMIARTFGYDEDLIIPVCSGDIRSWIATRPTFAGLDVSLANRCGFAEYTALDGLMDLWEAW